MAPAVTATHIHDRDNLSDQFISPPAGGDFGLPIDRLDHTSGTRRTTRYDAGRIALGKALVCVSNRCAVVPGRPDPPTDPEHFPQYRYGATVP